MSHRRVLSAVITDVAWVLWLMTAEFLSLRQSEDLFVAVVVSFVAGAVWAVIVNRRSTFWPPAVQAALAGIATGALVWFSSCSDCMVPQSVGAEILSTCVSLVTLGGLGLGWLVYNASGLTDVRMSPPRG